MQLSFGTRQISRIGEEKYEGLFDVGKFFIQPAHYPSCYFWETTDESIVFFLEPEYLLDTAAQTECLNLNKIELNPLAIGHDPTIEYIARSFLAEMQNEALGGRIYSETLATQFAIHLLRNYCTFPAQLKQYEKGLSRSQLQTVINYIDANLESNISLQQLANLCQLSSHYFCHLFKQSTGISAYQYVIQQRVAKAKQLLQQKDLPMVEIALMCGFSSQSALSRTFSKYVGTTPSKYRHSI